MAKNCTHLCIVRMWTVKFLVGNLRIATMSESYLKELDCITSMK